MLPFSNARATATLLVGSLAALLVLPATAVADNPAPQGPIEAAIDPQPELPPTAASAARDALARRGPAADANPDDGSSSDPTMSLPTTPEPELQPAACEPHLATFTRDGTVGSTTAIALTSQSIDRDVAGWLHVSWEAAPETSVTAITVVHTDGRRSVLAPSRQGTVDDVLGLTFCGEQTARPAEGGLDLGTGETNPVAVIDAGGDADADHAAVARARSSSASRDAAAPDPMGGRVIPASVTTGDDVTGPDDEVEVLGVQIVAPPRAALSNAPEPEPEAAGGAPALATAPATAATSTPTNGMHPLLLAAAIAAGLAGAVTVLQRHRPTATTGVAEGEPT